MRLPINVRIPPGWRPALTKPCEWHIVLREERAVQQDCQAVVSSGHWDIVEKSQSKDSSYLKVESLIFSCKNY